MSEVFINDQTEFRVTELGKKALKENLLDKIVEKAKEITDYLLFRLTVGTLLSDMYVWQRVEAIKQGVAEGLAEK